MAMEITPASISGEQKQNPHPMSIRSDDRGNGSGAIAHVVVRCLASMSMLAAVLVLFFNEETEIIAGFSMHASYKSSPAFKFFLIGNAIACAYSLVSVLFACCTAGGSRLVRLLDTMMMALVMASTSAASAIGYVAKNGNSETGWLKVCNYYKSFCNQAQISFACSYVGFILLLVVCNLPPMNKPNRRLGNP